MNGFYILCLSMQCLVQSNKRKIQKCDSLAVLSVETGLVWSDFNTCKFAESFNSWLPLGSSGRRVNTAGSFKA